MTETPTQESLSNVRSPALRALIEQRFPDAAPLTLLPPEDELVPVPGPVAPGPSSSDQRNARSTKNVA